MKGAFGWSSRSLATTGPVFPTGPAPVDLNSIVPPWVRRQCGFVSGKEMTSRKSKEPDLKEEGRILRQFVEQLIERGEAREFLVKNGFVTKSGKLTKRYGG